MVGSDEEPRDDMEENMTPEEKLDFWADVGLWAGCYIGRSLFGGAIRGLFGVPATPFLNSRRPRPAPVSPMLTGPAENTRNFAPASSAKSTEISPTAVKPGTLGR